MLLKLSQVSGTITKEAIFGAAPRLLPRVARAGHGARYQLAQAARVAESEGAMAAKARAATQSLRPQPGIKPNISSLRSASQGQPLPMAIPVEPTRTIRALPGELEEAAARAHLIKEPMLPSAVAQRKAGGTVLERTPAGPIQKAAPAKGAAPKKSQKDVKTEKVQRPKKQAPAAGMRKRDVAMATGIGTGTTIGVQHATGDEGMPKAAFIGKAVGSILSGGLKGGLRLGKAMLATPGRRAATGTAALVGGLGIHGAMQGASAQHPDGLSPFEAPTPYGKAVRYAYEEMK